MAKGDLVTFETMGKMKQAFSPLPGTEKTRVFSILRAIRPSPDIREFNVIRESFRSKKILLEFRLFWNQSRDRCKPGRAHNGWELVCSVHRGGEAMKGYLSLRRPPPESDLHPESNHNGGSLFPSNFESLYPSKPYSKLQARVRSLTVARGERVYTCASGHDRTSFQSDFA